MPTLTTLLLDFIMNLLGDPEAADKFRDDPEKALDEAGLGSVCSDDVDAILPVVLDYAPVQANSSFDREYNTGGNSASVGHQAPPPAPEYPAHHDDDDDHGHAIQQLTHIVNHYSYTSTVDDRDTVTDQSVNQNIWADGDVIQWFDNDAIIASGDGAIAAGGDVDVDNSQDHSIRAGEDVNIGNTDIDVDLDNVGNDNSVNHSNNTDASTNDSGNVEVDDINVGNTDNSVADSGNTDNSVADSGNTDNSVTDSGNTEIDTDLDVTVDDINVGNTDNSVTDSGNTEIETGDIVAGNTVSDNELFSDNVVDSGNGNAIDSGNGNAIDSFDVEDNLVVVLDEVPVE
ncbi:MAG: hypothetical protein JWQ68_946 [Cryobacterium sp.]|nr:hypothetical protein [Cryobacterium sp.]